MLSGATIYRCEDFSLDAQRLELRRGDGLVPIRQRPLQLLLFLIERRDRPVRSSEIFEHIWPDVVVGAAALSTTLRHLRRALGDDGKSQR